MTTRRKTATTRAAARPPALPPVQAPAPVHDGPFAPMNESEVQLVLRLVKDALNLGLSELRYKELFVRFNRPEPRGAQPPGPSLNESRALFNTWSGNIPIPDMSK